MFCPPYPVPQPPAQVVERAVVAAGLDGAEWQARLERGQKLARDAEAGRRGVRDAQRSAEDKIEEQAAELERLREEARSRAPGRWRRAHDVSCRAFGIFELRHCIALAYFRSPKKM